MNNKGLTFLEIIIALSVFSFALVGYFQIFRTALDGNNRATQEITAVNLARGLMAEIMSKNFEEPGQPDSFGREEGNNRYEFDDVDDYDTWSESPPVTVGIPGLPMDGTAETPDYSKFTRSVEVIYCIIDGGNNFIPDAGPTEFKQITVTVSGPYLREVNIVGIKTAN